MTEKDKNSYCVKWLNDNFDHEFRWFVLSRASKNCLRQKILGAYYIKTCQPSLNNQINSDLLNFLEMVLLVACFIPPVFILIVLNAQKYFVYMVNIFTF